MNEHWRRSALNSAGAFPVNFGEFSPIQILYFKIPRGGQKSRGAHAPLEPPRTAPLQITLEFSSHATLEYTLFHFPSYV